MQESFGHHQPEDQAVSAGANDRNQDHDPRQVVHYIDGRNSHNGTNNSYLSSQDQQNSGKKQMEEQ
jgi:hypothetical protein